MQRTENSVEEQLAHLQTKSLRLPDAKLSFVRVFQAALHDHAIPIVELLLDLHTHNVLRKKMLIAEFISERGDMNLYVARNYVDDLKNAVSDLAKAVGLRVKFIDRAYSDRYECPASLQLALTRADLPASFRDRLSESQSDLADSIAMNKKEITIEYVRAEERRLSVRKDIPVNFTLEIAFDFDLKSYRQNNQQHTGSYQTLIYRVSIVPLTE